MGLGSFTVSTTRGIVNFAVACFSNKRYVPCSADYSLPSLLEHHGRDRGAGFLVPSLMTLYPGILMLPYKVCVCKERHLHVSWRNWIISHVEVDIEDMGGVTLTLRFHCYFVYSIHNMGTRVPKCNMVIRLNEVRAEQHVPSELRQYDI